jgi:DNA-binding PadR family transcriptional regulator
MHNDMRQQQHQREPERIAKELVAASATPLVLSILSRGESYGYALIQEVRALSGGQLDWSEGMLYPVLHRMEDHGLIESYEARGDNGRKRKYYRLRPDGRRALAEERRQWDVVHAALSKAWRMA